MALTLDPATRLISVPQSDLTLVTGTLYSMDTDQFRKDVMDLLASEDYIWMADAYIHNTEVTVAGVTYARTLEFINGYSVQFTPNSAWSVRLEGSNNNIFDVENGILVQNQVQVIPTNSAGLISAGTALSTAEQQELADIHAAHFNRRRHDTTANTITIYAADNTTPLHVFDADDALTDITPQ